MKSHKIVFKSWFNLCDWLHENFTDVEMALSLDGGEFDSRLQNEDWQIEDVQQIDEEITK